MINENTVCSKRIEALKKEIKIYENISDILIFKEEDIFYLTGFYGRNSNSVFLITENGNFLFVNFIYFEEAKNSTRDLNIETILYNDDKNKLIADVLLENKITDVLIQSDFISHCQYLKMENDLRKSGIKSKSIDNPVTKFRVIKDDLEQKLIKKACSLTDKSFDFICSFKYRELLKFSESILAIEMEKFLISNGGDRRSFDFIFANNAGASKPHYSSQNIKINDGLLLMDYGVLFKNYCSDMTRTIFIGNNINNKLKEIYEIVKEAQHTAVDFCREGIRACELDRIARHLISQKGFGKNFGHSLGHGVGIEVHEQPFINSKNEEILKEGMILTIEPGIYIEGLGGIRIEDMVIVRKNKCENLYSSSREIINIC
ncbi:MAG: aminopeptidase P family protein [Actinobacteria bacterium]|nr:aminopeptidase P family protein [Cyanobacteriota bacterium]MCL6087155.1 aminopeptidase P family protein [Actinomycetota bacterium]